VHTISAGTHHMRVDYSLFEGFTVKGTPNGSSRAARLFVDGPRWLGAPGRGSFVRRGTYSGAWDGKTVWHPRGNMVRETSDPPGDVRVWKGENGSMSRRSSGTNSISEAADVTGTCQECIHAKPTLEGAGVHLPPGFRIRHTSDFDPFLLLDDFRNDIPEEYLAGFPWHPHRGIETITYVLAGSVEHGDSMGNRGSHHVGRCSVDDRREAASFTRRCEG